MKDKRQTGRTSGQKNSLLWLVLMIVLIIAAAAAIKPVTKGVYCYLYPQKYQQYIERYSKEYGVETDLVYAVAKVESNFDPEAVSSADARGVMQMTEDAFDWVKYRMGDTSEISYKDIFEPQIAIQYGTYMLHLLLEETGDEKLAICSYHAGMGNVNSWLSQEEFSKDGKTLDKIPYSDTKWYYNKVIEVKQIYRELYS